MGKCLKVSRARCSKAGLLMILIPQRRVKNFFFVMENSNISKSRD